jgi:catechol 2,3-dioxygenase
VPIDPATHVGAVRLRVNDLAQAKSFYDRMIGLRELEGDGDTVRLGPEGGPSLVELIGDPDAPRRPAGSTGLFHLALLVPSRVELARALRRVMNGGWQFTGASDHLVSEALYLRDPEYNGIEIYRDRPRDEWAIVDGQIQMATLPLDLQGIAGLADDADDGMPAETTMGHVHLQVAGLAPADSFYHRLLGMDVTVRSYPGALFMSAGGYHHHIGANTWESHGGPAPPPGSAGLDSFELVLPTADAVQALADSAASSGSAIQQENGAVALAEPSGAKVLLTSKQQ